MSIKRLLIPSTLARPAPFTTIARERGAREAWLLLVACRDDLYQIAKRRTEELHKRLCNIGVQVLDRKSVV